MPDDVNLISQKPKKRSRQFRGRDFWVQQVTAWRQSGLSKKAYALKHELSLGTFNKWSTKLSQETASDSNPVFVPVQVTPLDRKPDDRVEITLPNGFKVTVPAASSPKQALVWITAVASIA